MIGIQACHKPRPRVSFLIRRFIPPKAEKTLMQKKMILEGRDVIDFHIEAPYFQALYNAPIPVFIAREDGRFILINKAFKMATGFSIEDIPTIEDWARHLVSDSVSETVK